MLHIIARYIHDMALSRTLFVVDSFSIVLFKFIDRDRRDRQPNTLLVYPKSPWLDIPYRFHDCRRTNWSRSSLRSITHF